MTSATSTTCRGGTGRRVRAPVRVLHERSFLDDPTRLLGAVRYAARLGFELHPETERLAREAMAADALATVSGARIRDELLDLLRRADAPAGIARMRDLEIHCALHPELDPIRAGGVGLPGGGRDRRGARRLRSRRPHRAALPRSSTSGSRICIFRPRSATPPRRAARVAPRIAAALREREHSPSELRALLGREPLEALALALALRAPSEPILRWVDAICAGVSPRSPATTCSPPACPRARPSGGRSTRRCNRKLDGLVSGRDAELETALQLAQEHAQ